ncbi:ras-related protein R-Ras [Myotis lucifugus]|uniref:ras-related protein R-Ras n=1 Tax=Myotis lucifugus TaxID=59463 RepID=UPI000CCC747F|nr:ras-related protein R-Ras [Myotis lucifugus]
MSSGAASATGRGRPRGGGPGPGDPPPSETHKLVVVGGGGVGKSALTIQFIQVVGTSLGGCPRDPEHSPWGGIPETPIFSWGGGVLSSRTSRLWASFLCSFNEVSKLFTQILRVKDRDDFPIVLVGNKADLEAQRQVPRSEANTFSASHHVAYFEASAKLRLNVDEAFEQLVRAVRKYQEQELPPSPPSAPRKKARGCPCVVL